MSTSSRRSSAPARRRASTPRRFALPRALKLTSALAVLALVAGSITAGIVLAPTAQAAAGPTVTVGASGDGPKGVLAGENETLSIGVANDSTEAWFNLAVSVTMPAGVEFVSSALGAPKIYTAGQQLPNGGTVPSGQAVWVWQDISDLPAGAARTFDLVVKPAQPAKGAGETDAPTVFPVGSTFSSVATAYASAAPRYLPVFPGSTGKGGQAAIDATRTGNAPTADTTVNAIRVTKSEPSPESELLRGVHAHDTQYTITVQNSDQGATTGVTVVDFLPAGLEFLGCGNIDNSSSEEYPGSGPLDLSTSDVPDCIPADSVMTVEKTADNASEFPEGLADGVYTQVNWGPFDLAEGETREIVYAAGIPLQKNTMNWGTTDVAALGLTGQAANLDNNNGESTRQSDGDTPATDGDVYTNAAGARGSYTGVVRTGTDRTVSDSDTESVHSMDLRVLKRVDTEPTDGAATGAQATPSTKFFAGKVAKYTLNIASSEYVSAANIGLTDVIPNGLCPILPAGTPIKSGPVEIPQLDGTTLTVPGEAAFPEGCAPGAAAGDSAWTDPAVSGATVEWVAFEKTTNRFIVHFAIDPMAASDSHDVVYPVLMRDLYEGDQGTTTSLDNFVNTVALTGETTGLQGEEKDVVASVADDSSATITAAGSSISKKVLERGYGDLSGGCPAESALYKGDEDNSTDLSFVFGDLVCYELTVNFAKDAQTRNPIISDMIPEGLGDVQSAAVLYQGTTPVAGFQPGATVADGVMTWKPWTHRAVGSNPVSDRLVPAASRLVIHVWGTVNNVSASAVSPDKPQNLMKYQQNNVHGEIFFDRDAVAVTVEAGLQLKKGVRDVNGTTTLPARTQTNADGAVFGSNRDGIQVVENDDVTYRIDLSNAPQAVHGLTVTDTLPAGIIGDDVTDANGGTVSEVTPGVWQIVWSGVSVAKGGNTTLNYTVKIPAGTSVTTELVNEAAITSYRFDTNTGTDPLVEPGKPAYPGGPLVPDAGTTDVSDVYLPPVTTAKRVISTDVDGTNNNGNGGTTPRPQAVHGEYITYEYSVTIPANTSVKNAVLADAGVLAMGQTKDNYTVKPGSVVLVSPAGGLPVGVAADGTTPATGTLNASTGTLTFPALYDNTSATPVTFAVQISVYTDGPGTAAAEWAQGNVLRNTASFTSTGAPRQDKSADVQYVVPRPTIAKSVDAAAKPNVTAGQTLTYTLTATNAAGRPTSFGTVVTDCVPAGLAVNPFDPARPDVTITPNGCGAPADPQGTQIVWTVGALVAGSPQTLAYTAQVSPDAAGGASYLNSVGLVGYALENVAKGDARQLELVSSDTETVTVASAITTKTVDKEKAPIGDVVTYTVTTELPADANFYDAQLIDDFPAGISLVDGSSTFSCVDEDGDVCTTPSSWSAPVIAGQKATWSVTDAGGDIASSAKTRTVTVSYEAVLTDDIVIPSRPETLDNEAYFIWNTTNNDPSTTTETEKGVGPVAIIEPGLTIKKFVETKDAQNAAAAHPAAPESTLNYELVVTNPGGTYGSTAYDAIVVDTIPALLRDVTVDQAALPAGVSAVVATDGTTGITTVTWTIASIAMNSEVRLPYTATLAPSDELDGSTITNTAGITEFWSMPAGSADRREYVGGTDPAVIVPAFPEITVEKSAAAGVTASVGTAFPWSITIRNTGNGTAQSVTATDTLPAGWDSPTVTAITRNGIAVLPEDWDPSDTPLQWTFANVAPADVIVVTLAATPRAAAYLNPPAAGVGPNPAGPENPHTNVVEITAATDSTGSATHLGPDDDQIEYAGATDDADAFLRATDLSIEKTLVPLADADAKRWEGDTVQFLLTVTNNGPQTAAAVSISDTLPDGLTFAGVSTPGVGAGGLWNACSTVSETLSCTLIAPLAAGGTATVTVTAIAEAHSGTALSTTLTNTASVATTTPETDSTNNSDDADVTIWAKPRIEIVKKADVAGGAAIAGSDDDTQYVLDGQTPQRIAHFSITVTNTGPVALENITVTDALAPDCVISEPFSLAPAATRSFECDGPAPSSAGYTNTAAVTGETEEGDTASDSDTSDAVLSAIDVEKSGIIAAATPSSPVAGEIVNYTFTVTNTGGSTLTAVELSDVLPGLSEITFGAWPDPAAPGTLLAGQEVGASATYVLSQDDIDNAAVDNTVTVIGTDPAGQTPTDADTVTVTPGNVPAIELVKTGSESQLPLGEAGDTITYTFLGTNTGNTTLTDVTITDPLPGLGELEFDWSDAYADGVLRPGDTVSATAEYTLTQDDVDSGTVSNTATVAGIAPDTTPVDDDDSWNVDITPQPRIELDKSGPLSVGKAGDEVTYTFIATNTGSVTLSGVEIVDPLTGLSALSYDWPGADGVLAPGAFVTATATYTVTQADADAHEILNAATVEGTPPTGPAVDDGDDHTVIVPAQPGIEIVKTGAMASGATGLLGETVEYTFVATNTGNVTLTGVTIDDVSLPGLSPLTLGDWPGVSGELAPGDSIDATASYTLTQADIELGYVDNVATTEGTPPVDGGGDPSTPVTDEDDERVTTLQAPAITLEKTAAFAADQIGAVGDTVEYGFTAVNTGNVTLTDVTITDPKTGLSALSYSWQNAEGVLLPGEAVTATAVYTVTQDDVDAGTIENLATATGTPPSGTPVTDEDDAVVNPPQAPAIELVKDAAIAADGTGVAGDTVNYSFTVTNTGDVSLHGVGITDPMAGLSAITFGDWPDAAGTLLPGESVTASADYVLTQADVDAGIVNNLATTNGTPQVGPAVSDEDPASVTTLVNPAIELVKTGAFAGGAGGVVGGTIEYGFTVTNTGTVTLNGVTISDPLDGLSEVTFGDWPAVAGTLLPGESVTATASLPLTQAHIDGGTIENTATATGTPPAGGPVESVSDTDDVTLTVTPTPAIGIEKSGSLIAGATGVVGDGVLFTMVATNTGNVTLHDVTVSDPLPGLSALTYGSWPAEEGVLEPGASVTVTARYVLTAADVAAGTVTNVAGVTGEHRTPDGVSVVVDDESTATVTLPVISDGGLSTTGIEAAAMIGTGVLIVGLGALLLLVARRRRTRREA